MAVNSIRLILEFEQIFPHEKRLNPEEYLKGGDKDFILKVAAFFLGFKSSNSKFHDNENLLRAIFSEENAKVANEIFTRIKEIEKTQGKRTITVNRYSSLCLFEYFFQREYEENTQTNKEFELNVFKAYLVFNSRFTSRQGIAFESTKNIAPKLRPSIIAFCMTYAYADKESYNIGVILEAQLTKAIYLFQFLESNNKTKPLLEAFLLTFNVDSWQDYLKRLIPIVTSTIINEDESCTYIDVTKSDVFEADCSFIEKLIVLGKDPLNENDFTSLRAKPMYRIKEGIYGVIFNLFIVEKVYKGLYFMLRDINESLTESEKIPNIKSIFGYEFSEKFLTYRILDSLYPKDKSISFSGDELEQQGVVAAPDYYVRKGKSIIIFETKDFLIPASAKNSFDFNTYETEFAKKLYFEKRNGKDVPKAVLQLIGNIRKLLNKEFLVDKGYKYREVEIYPVLLIHDHQYDVIGFNTLINRWFTSELEVLKEEGLFIHRVKPLFIVNIDTLIYYQEVLKENMLHNVLEQYKIHLSKQSIRDKNNFDDAPDFELRKDIPLAEFIDKTYPNKKDVSEQLRVLLLSLFE